MFSFAAFIEFFWNLVLFILFTIYSAVIYSRIKAFFEDRRAARSADRIKLRDKGEVKNGLVCSYCSTTVRIGINKNGEAFKYCWRCECIFSDDSDDGPGGGESEPVVESKPDLHLVGSNVVEHTSKKKVA